MDVLGFEGFDGGSHRAVRLSIERHSRQAWRWVTLPARAWKWRMRTGAIELVDLAREQGRLDEHCDALFATSMVAITDLRALLPPAWRETPLVLYMHENQVAYPVGHETGPADRDAHFGLTNLASVLAADAVLWNSAWNLESFITGIEALLSHAPDGRLADVEDRIRARSRVLWPPVEIPAALHNPGRPSDNRAPVKVAWPHRWEHDKGPDELLEIATRLSDRLDLRWTILGERFRQVPPALREFQETLAGRIDHIGFVDDHDEYLRHLAGCDWVLSTARHEFFGIAVVEAMLAGCLPWLPDRLSYPELLPEPARGISPARPPADPEQVRRRIAEHLDEARAPRAVWRLDGVLEQLELPVGHRPPERAR